MTSAQDEYSQLALDTTFRAAAMRTRVFVTCFDCGQKRPEEAVRASFVPDDVSPTKVHSVHSSVSLFRLLLLLAVPDANVNR